MSGLKKEEEKQLATIDTILYHAVQDGVFTINQIAVVMQLVVKATRAGISVRTLVAKLREAI